VIGVFTISTAAISCERLHGSGTLEMTLIRRSMVSQTRIASIFWLCPHVETMICAGSLPRIDRTQDWNSSSNGPHVGTMTVTSNGVIVGLCGGAAGRVYR